MVSPRLRFGLVLKFTHTKLGHDLGFLDSVSSLLWRNGLALIKDENGRVLLDGSQDICAFEHEQNHLAARKLSDPWMQLAAAVHLVNDRQALDKLLKQHPEAAVGIGKQ